MIIQKFFVPLRYQKIQIMEFKDISKWFWDIAKYVVSAIIISSFLGGYEEKSTLYMMSILVAGGLMIAGTIFYKLSKKK